MSASAASSLIIGSNVVSFLPGIASDERARIRGCLLFAELHADRVADPKTAWRRWFDTYQRMLVVAGFEHTAMLDGSPVKVSNKKGFERESTKIVSRVRSRDLAVAAQGALDTLFKSSHAQSFFKDWLNFSSSRSDSFQVIPCQKNHSGQTGIAVCALQMTTRTKLKTIPRGGWPFIYEMTLLLQGGSYNFSQNNYEKNRTQVERELLEMRADRLNEIQL
jgi:hypothetical protein